MVSVLGPNNFPFAFNSSGGGDFAAAVATCHPVSPRQTRTHGNHRLLADNALLAAIESGLPAATVQIVYDMPVEAACAWFADPRVAATAFTGSTKSGLALKSAAEEAGRLIYWRCRA